eukprot:1496904-Rhodomonas_salina.1
MLTSAVYVYELSSATPSLGLNQDVSSLSGHKPEWSNLLVCRTVLIQSGQTKRRELSTRIAFAQPTQAAGKSYGAVSMRLCYYALFCTETGYTATVCSVLCGTEIGYNAKSNTRHRLPDTKCAENAVYCI